MNIENAIAVRDRILAEANAPPPKGCAFNMATWFCGTAGCIAGTAVLMHGWRPQTRNEFCETIRKDGAESGVQEVAGDILGLAPRKADGLFSWGWPIWHRNEQALLQDAMDRNDRREQARLAAQVLTRLIDRHTRKLSPAPKRTRSTSPPAPASAKEETQEAPGGEG